MESQAGLFICLIIVSYFIMLSLGQPTHFSPLDDVNPFVLPECINQVTSRPLLDTMDRGTPSPLPEWNTQDNTCLLHTLDRGTHSPTPECMIQETTSPALDSMDRYTPSPIPEWMTQGTKSHPLDTMDRCTSSPIPESMNQ